MNTEIGSLIRQRYKIEKILGCGGFGQTYLAADQERFNEPCVIKEFKVPYQDDGLIEKAKTLFQREASILYQIQHPQIPRFWAAFENEQRLFLVQDFVKGQTYRSLLKTRKQQGKAFSEVEVLYLLNHLLPVLSYLHDREIIHRDISPENIMLQPSAKGTPLEASLENTLILGLPVLIDFGAVKEAASHWPIVSTITRVGKVGYAPPEQLQTGNVSAHSDIYALGATCLVLLTGREPQTLLDSQTLSWQWQPYAQMSDLLATVLQKMLALHPGDRYQSAREAWADLQPLMEGAIQNTALLSPVATSSTEQEIAPAARDIIDSRVLTSIKSKLRMDSHQEPVGADIPRSILRRMEASRSRRRRGIAPGIAIAASLLVTTGIGTHLFRVTAASNNQTLPGERSRTVSPIPSDGKPRKIEFPPGAISTMEQGNLQNINTQPYRIEAEPGQIMTLTLEGPGVMMNVLRANGQKIDNASKQTRSWTGQLPAKEEYIIQVTGSGGYSLDVAITPHGSSPSADFQRVTFDPGKEGTTVTGRLTPTRIRRYSLDARTRQIMTLRVLKGDVKLAVTAPNGQKISGNSPKEGFWQGRLPMQGDYIIEVSTVKATDYALALEVRKN